MFYNRMVLFGAHMGLPFHGHPPWDVSSKPTAHDCSAHLEGPEVVPGLDAHGRQVDEVPQDDGGRE